MNKLLVVPVALGMIACGGNKTDHEPPNILWITHEDLSPIYGCYGDDYARTPNIDLLAESGYRFINAFSNAPICAPARSTLITGMYATSLGTQHLRSEIPVPSGMKILPEVLMEAGYYTTNNVKTDYNFDHTGRWDESSDQAHWRNRPEGKPFFSVFNFMITHEGPINALRRSDTGSLEEFSDPAGAELPPYLPDSERMREIWAHMYDLLAVFDQGVGELLDQLKEDGLYENTIVFVFSDHGHGLPGHKRWLDNGGLQVPFILHVPDKYKHLVTNLEGPVTDRKVGFVDFAPTVITLAGTEVPDIMEGRNFLGAGTEPKEYIYGYRDRADDCYEVSRSVYDGRYLYVRHFMPQLPYFQQAIIFGPNKEGSYEEIHRLRNLGLLPEGTMRMFERKSAEELFDLENDRWEENNLINESELAGVVEDLREKVTSWILDYHDTGMFSEGEMMMRASGNNTSVYEMARGYTREDFRGIINAAQMVGKINDPAELIPFFEAEESAVRFWALIALDAFEGDISSVDSYLDNLLDDPSLSNAAKAAEIKIKRYNDQKAFRVLENILDHDYEPLVLQAAISVRQLKEKAEPLLPLIEDKIMPKYSGNVWGRYRTWSYPMFIGMALDQTMINNGIDLGPIPVR
jgi:N-sulfoglucosamine sulfohydrolase